MEGRPQILHPISEITPISDLLSYKGCLSVERRQTTGERKKRKKFLLKNRIPPFTLCLGLWAEVYQCNKFPPSTTSLSWCTGMCTIGLITPDYRRLRVHRLRTLSRLPCWSLKLFSFSRSDRQKQVKAQPTSRLYRRRGYLDINQFRRAVFAIMSAIIRSNVSSESLRPVPNVVYAQSAPQFRVFCHFKTNRIIRIPDITFTQTWRETNDWSSIWS